MSGLILRGVGTISMVRSLENSMDLAFSVEEQAFRYEVRQIFRNRCELPRLR